MYDLSWLNPTPHAIAVYASRPLSPVAPQHSLPSGRYSLLGPDLHRQDRTSFAWRVAVGTRVTSRPPHRSVHETFPHTAPTSGPNASSNTDAHAAIACDMLNPAQCPEHALMARMVECLDRALN